MRLRLPLPELQTVQLPVCGLPCRLSYTTALQSIPKQNLTLSYLASAFASELAYLTARPKQNAQACAPGSKELDPARHAEHASMFKFKAAHRSK